MAEEPRPPSLLRRISSRLSLERDWYLILIAAIIGIVMGGVATAFITPLRAIEEWVQHRDHNPALMLVLITVAPAAGGLLAGFVIHALGSSARGIGVSAVMYSIHREKSKLPLRLALQKWVSSTLTIGSGGSAGAEGPIVTIGASIGSTLGRWFRISPQNMATLLGCGAAAGMASIFGAPIAGIFFCLEILLRDFSLRAFAPIVIASVLGSVSTHTMLGGVGQDTGGLFRISETFFETGEFVDLFELPNYFVLGVLCGIFAPFLIRMLFVSNEFFSRLRVHAALRPAIGGAVLGLIGLGYVLIRRPENPMPPFFGNGYPVIAEFLSPSHYAGLSEGTVTAVLAIVFSLLAIAVLKAIGTCLTIGSGGAGGLFAPSLLMGAGVGGAIGTIFSALGLFPVLNPAHYALVGMGATVASTTHAPLTGIFIVYEITDRTEEILLPLMFATIISTLVTRLISHDSVYTWKLSRMGVRIGQMSDLTILRRLAVSDMPLADAVMVPQYDSAERLLELSERHQVSDFVVTADDGTYAGMVVAGDLRMAMLQREAIPLLVVDELLRTDLPTISPDETLDIVLDKFSSHDVYALPVLDRRGDGAVLGLVTRDRLMRRYQEALEED